MPLTITDGINDRVKLHWRILGGSWKISGLIENFKF
jgi:hypothetical protein